MDIHHSHCEEEEKDSDKSGADFWLEIPELLLNYFRLKMEDEKFMEGELWYPLILRGIVILLLYKELGNSSEIQIPIDYFHILTKCAEALISFSVKSSQIMETYFQQLRKSSFLLLV